MSALASSVIGPGQRHLAISFPTIIKPLTDCISWLYVWMCCVWVFMWNTECVVILCSSDAAGEPKLDPRNRLKTPASCQKGHMKQKTFNIKKGQFNKTSHFKHFFGLSRKAEHNLWSNQTKRACNNYSTQLCQINFFILLLLGFQFPPVLAICCMYNWAIRAHSPSTLPSCGPYSASLSPSNLPGACGWLLPFSQCPLICREVTFMS